MIKTYEEFINEGLYDSSKSKNQIKKFQNESFTLNDINDYSIYLNIFNKIDIYNKNTKVIAEGRTKYSNYIPYNTDERRVIGLVLENYFTNTIIQYINDSNLVTEKLSFDDAKKLVNGGKEKIKELIEKFKEKIPSEVIEAYEFLIKSLNKGIKTAKDLLETIGKLLQKLGDTIVDALDKLKLFNSEYCSALPETNVDTHGLIEFKDENQKQLIGYIINEVSENVKEKQKEKDENLNEGKVGKTLAIGGIAALGSVAPGLALLAGGGYGFYKLLKYIGPKLSDKLEPYLLNDKTKEFANKLYNNKFARYSLGLSKSNDDDNSESTLKSIGKILWSIMVNFVIATLVSSIISLFVTTLIGTGPATGLIIATIIGSKNIFKIVINRVLNFKKETKTKDGNTKVNYFFDMLTMIGILSSVSSIVVKIPGFNEWFNKVLGKIFNFGITKSSAAETSLKFDKDMLKVNGNGGESENLGSFESVKKLLDNAENMEDPAYGSSNDTVTSFRHVIQSDSSTDTGSEFSRKFVESITSVTKSSNEYDLMYATKNSISDDGIVTSLSHVFTTENGTFIDGKSLTHCRTLKEIFLNFVKLHDEESNIGFIIESRLIEGASVDDVFIKGILSSTGKILKIEEIVGANADELVGKQWDELTNLLMK
jgi:F0F1-type ATP synthase assembly protein I